MSPHQRCDARGGDRKARFVQTAERHAGLSQFAAPFLSSRQPAGEVLPPPRGSRKHHQDFKRRTTRAGRRKDVRMKRMPQRAGPGTS